jgi:hypothetical protein
MPRRHLARASLPLLAALVLSSCGSPSVSSSPATSSRIAEPIDATPVPAKDNELADITCPSPTDCIAVGHIGEGASTLGPDNRTLILQGGGAGWQVVPSPNAPNEAGSELFGVTCLSPDNCIAVGQSDTSGSTPTTLIEQNGGSGWTLVPSPNANAYGGIGSLSGVACASATHCVAVGDYQSENAAYFQTLIEQNFGNGWKVVPSANTDPSEDNSLAAVACPSSSLCIAVGSRGKDRNLPLIEQNTGAGWTLVPATGIGSLSGIACPSTRRCVATGGNFSWSDRTLAEEPLIEELVDGVWIALPTPHQAGSLVNVACPTPTYCISVGDVFRLGQSNQSPLIVAEKGSNGWTVALTKDIGNQEDSFSAVACADAARCIAVGHQHVGIRYPGVDATFIAQHTSQGWTVQASPNG